MVPGQLLSDPEKTEDKLEDLLQQVRLATNNKAIQTSRHNPPERPLTDIPEGVTHAYTRQHQTTGLQANFEGPFRIDSRVSKSVVKLEVGCYKDGTKRYELRHLNDIKLSHPESLASPVERPKLGRPPKPSTNLSGQSSTEAPDGKVPSFFPSAPLPQQPSLTAPSKQTSSLPSNATSNPNNHETSILENRQPASEDHSDFSMVPSGPPPLQPFSSNRPVRTTRNPRPYYVDATRWDSVRPWSASQDEIEMLNRSIGSRQI